MDYSSGIHFELGEHRMIGRQSKIVEEEELVAYFNSSPYKRIPFSQGSNRGEKGSGKDVKNRRRR